MYKKCSKCKKILLISEFNWKIKNVKYSYHCKECSRKYVREHYSQHVAYYLKKASLRNLKLKLRAINYLGPYLLSHPCVDCGETNILALEFDHKDRKNKTSEIRRIIQNGASLQEIIREVQKCDIRCANCHRIKTEKENNSWKLKYASVA